MEEKKYEGIFFDLDGTMWDSTDGIIEAWRMAVSEFDELKDFEMTTELIKSVMGLPMDEIFSRLFKDAGLDKELVDRINERCCERENEYLAEHGGILYPKLEETLSKLSEKYTLAIVSNGQAGYIQSFLKAHQMEKYFKDFQNWGDNKVSKGENILEVMKRNKLKNVAYVGDTQGDANAAKMAGCDFIYAEYGFGEVEDYAYKIKEFCELEKILL